MNETGVRSNKPLGQRLRWVSQVALAVVVGIAVGWGSVATYHQVTANPAPVIDRFDPDIYPAIDVGHTAPVIVQANESVTLEFRFACGFALPNQQSCHPDATLFATWGAADSFKEVALTEENRDSLRVLTAKLPVVDGDGAALRYYLEVREAISGATTRYPAAGAIEPTVISDFTPIALSAGQDLAYERVLDFPWGSGEAQVGLDAAPNQATVGPDSFDVAPDGTIALLDQMNQRVLVVDPTTQATRNYPVPVKGVGDIEINAQGQISVLDLVGEQRENVPVPQLFTLGPNGDIIAQTAIYTRRPTDLAEDGSVFDRSENRLVAAVSGTSEADTRALQREKRSRPELQVQFVSPTQARLVDNAHNLAFEVTAADELGAIAYFGRTPNGYVAVFETAQLRVVWFTAKGDVVNEGLMPNSQFSVFNPTARVATDQTGAVYILGSTEAGVEVLRVNER